MTLPRPWAVGLLALACSSGSVEASRDASVDRAPDVLALAPDAMATELSVDVADAVAPDAADDVAADALTPDAPEVDAPLPEDRPGDGGATVDGGETLCTSSYRDLTESELRARISPNGACAGDVALVCTGNLMSIARACATSCLGMGPVCVETCLTNQVTTLSSACAGCYVGTTSCEFQMCLTECIANPAAPRCVQCRDDKGCTSAFLECSGLPRPPGDAGAG